MQQAIKQNTTRENYLAWEEQSNHKHEFFQGEIFAMSGGSFNHARLSVNILSSLSQSLRGKPCQPMNSDMRIQTPTGLDTYPDVSVFCGEPELSDQQRTLLNPVVIFEILSPSTRDYDRGDKFASYRSITTLHDYILVDSENIRVEHFRRADNKEWVLHEYNETKSSLFLPIMNTDLTLLEIYQGIVFPDI
ncbi:Uma2 family endonuclease [Candidatus Venteria ishoeyi]|uniref:Uma2 family endonuclease n=1 Tax=Candidatus Venteria ishoeyi TaxID=1899563 RepID=UPI0025A53FCE|nr:Uma2 family endonuclease [Candidatus Venteria ishoeyi]MDM8546689.1 Uma2 family endonuclease [Candidatus Venteria ishoeyi]